MRRLNQVPLTFVRHERADIADDRRLMRKKERLVDVDGRRGEHVLDVDAFVHRDDVRFGNAIGHEHRPDRIRGGDETIDLPVFPSRERIALEMKIDAARRDQRWRAAIRRRPAAKRQRQ